MTFPFLLKKLKYYYKKNEFDEDAWKDLTERIGKKPRVLFMTPQGKPFSQKLAEEYAKEEDLIFLWRCTIDTLDIFPVQVRTQLAIMDVFITNNIHQGVCGTPVIFSAGSGIVWFNIIKSLVSSI